MKGAVIVAKLPNVSTVVLSKAGAGTGASTPSTTLTVEVIELATNCGRTVIPRAAPALIRAAPTLKEKPTRPPVKASLKSDRLKGLDGVWPAGVTWPPEIISVTLIMVPIVMEAWPPPRSTWVQVNSNLGSAKLCPAKKTAAKLLN